MNKMYCHYCEENYIARLFDKCIRESTDYIDGLKRFNQECINHEDPRNLVTILGFMYAHDCQICRKYKHLYEDETN